MAALAFYKAQGNYQDKLIRFRTMSPYSHVELVIDRLCYSSSPRDGGVRKKIIELEPNKWDLVAVPWLQSSQALRVFEKYSGSEYDLLGVLVGQLFNAPIHDRDKCFCSELVAEMLGFEQPWRYSPASLYLVVNEINKQVEEKSRA